MNVPNTYASAMATLQVLKLSEQRKSSFTIGEPYSGLRCECGRPGRRRHSHRGAHTISCNRCHELEGEHPTISRLLRLLEDGVSMSTDEVAGALALTRLGAHRLLHKLAKRGRLRTWLEARTSSATRSVGTRQTTELRMWRRAW